MVVRVFQALVVFGFVRIVGSAQIGIAKVPETLDELVALVVRLELQKLVLLVPGDDVVDFFLQPSLVILRQLFLGARGEGGRGDQRQGHDCGHAGQDCSQRKNATRPTELILDGRNATEHRHCFDL